MSFFTRKCFTLSRYKRICSNYSCNDLSLLPAKYYTCSNSNRIQSKVIECKTLGQRHSSLLSNIKFTYYDYKIKIMSLMRNKYQYIPFFSSGKYRYEGYLLYKSLDEVNINDFFTIFNMDDTFYSRYKIIELHIWMLMYSLPRGVRIYNMVRIGLVEAMWEDTQNRAKIIDKHNENYKKNMRTLSAKFKMALMLYDDGYSYDDMKLSSALWYNFFDREVSDPRYVEILVFFIRHHMDHLSKINFENLMKKKVKTGLWLSVKPHAKEILKSSNVLSI